MRRVYLPVIVMGLSLLAAGCQGIKTEASYPTRPEGSDKIVYSDEKRETIWGEGRTLGDRLFGRDGESKADSGLAVNSFLWRASLDTIAFMPITSADAFGGTILTDWYQNPDTPNERYKVNIYVLDKQLRADGVRVAVFKQKKEKGGWRDIEVSPATARDIENTILTRARDMRVAQMGRDRN